MTNISGEKYLLGTEKLTKKKKTSANHYLALTFMGICASFFFFLMDCICQQHIVTSTGAGDFVNRVPYPY